MEIFSGTGLENDLCQQNQKEIKEKRKNQYSRCLIHHVSDAKRHIFKDAAVGITIGDRKCLVFPMQPAPPINIKDTRIFGYLRDVERLYRSIEKLYRYFDICLRINVYMLDSLTEMEKATKKKIPAWVVGTHKNDEIFVLRYKLRHCKEVPMSKLIVHELVHILIRKISRKICPRIIDEGLAVYLSRQFMEIIDIRELVDDKTNLLQLNYDHPKFYQISYTYILNLVNEIGIEKLINELKTCTDYYKSPVFRVQEWHMDRLTR